MSQKPSRVPSSTATQEERSRAASRSPLSRLPVPRVVLAGFLALGGLGLALSACEREQPPVTTPEPEPEVTAPEVEAEAPTFSLVRRDFSDLAGWDEDSVAEAVPAILSSCSRLRFQDAERPVGPDGIGGTAGDWQVACEALLTVPEGADAVARRTLEAAFVPYLVEGPDGPEGLFTGYYEAELNGADFPGGGYDTPLYRNPDDAIRVNLTRFRADLPGETLIGRLEGNEVVPYHSRGEIDDGVLDGRNLELLWVDDPVDAFFLHVQGSGQVRMPDGQTRRVGFAGSNGRPFTAIGRALIDSGEMTGHDMSMQGIRDWLRANPERADELMRSNTRFIFFREIEGPGPIGAQGLPLTPGRSLAVDPAFLPLGAPIYLETTYPGEQQPLNRLMVAQDTGSAIKGAVRGDFFWGTGEAALEYAGRMRQRGQYYLFLPRAVAERRDATS